MARVPPMLKTVVPATLSIAAGDSVCQRLEGKEEWDPARTGRMAMTGFFLVTPVMHVLFSAFERALPGRSLSHLLAKAGLNSMCTGLFIAGSFTGNAFLSNKSVDLLQTQLEERLMPTFMVGMQYWPLANLLLLRLASPGARALGTVVAGTAWNTYLSSRLNAPIRRRMTSAMANSRKPQPYTLPSAASSLLLKPARMEGSRQGGAMAVMAVSSSSSSASEQRHHQRVR